MDKPTMNEILVLYYSRYGSTAEMAQGIARGIEADNVSYVTLPGGSVARGLDPHDGRVAAIRGRYNARFLASSVRREFTMGHVPRIVLQALG